MTKWSKVIGVAFAAAAGFSLAAQAADLPKTNLKVLGGNQTQNMYRYIEKPFFTKGLEKASNGAITTTFGSLEELGLNGTEVLRLLRAGVFDISEGTLSYMAGDDARFDGLDLPGVTLDIDTQRKAVDAYRSILAKEMMAKFNTKLLSLSPIALQVFYCKANITGLASLKGKKVRVFNRASADFVESAGGSTVNLPFSEVVPALQRGVADCAMTGTSAGNTARWWEVTHDLYVMPMGWSMTFFGANLNRWQQLDPKVRSFLEKQFADLENRQWDQAKADIQDGINCDTGKGDCKRGVKASPPMTLVPVSQADKTAAQKDVADKVLPGWAARCGAECVEQWNQTVGKVAGVTAKVK